MNPADVRAGLLYEKLNWVGTRLFFDEARARGQSASGDDTSWWSVLDMRGCVGCCRFVIGQYVTVHGDVISHVNISHVVVEDGGEYSCTAENRAGKAMHSARLNVYGKELMTMYIFPLSRPSPPLAQFPKYRGPGSFIMNLFSDGTMVWHLWNFRGGKKRAGCLFSTSSDFPIGEIPWGRGIS